VHAAIAQDTWVFEGNHHATFPERIARADTVVFLDFPTVLRVWRVILRTWRSLGKTRPDMGAGCPERFNLEFIFKWVAGYRYRSYARDIAVLNKAPAHVKCHHLKSSTAVDRFCKKLSSSMNGEKY
jgi:adenylate kinase family enzyme